MPDLFLSDSYKLLPLVRADYTEKTVTGIFTGQFQ